jgi:plastocyanin domain-containing protein
MKNTTLLMVMSIMILLVGGFVAVKGKSNITGNVVAGDFLPGEIQRVVLSQDGYNYKDVTVDAGKPLVVSADDSVRGCLRSAVFNIDGKKYSQYLRNSQDTLQLPALEKGTYTFSCSMGMGFGKLIAK